MGRRLHLVFGGELADPERMVFRDLREIDIVGIFPDYESARDAWRSSAQRTVDNARTRYFIADLHRLREDVDGRAGGSGTSD